MVVTAEALGSRWAVEGKEEDGRVLTCGSN